MAYEEVELSRDVEVVMIPQGITTTLTAGTPAVITQSLGDSYTLQVPTFGGLYRLSGKDADAIGKAAARSDGVPGADPDAPVTDELDLQPAAQRLRPRDPGQHRRARSGLRSARSSRWPTGGSRVEVKMTLTAPGCGMGDVIAQDAKSRIESVPGVKEADVQVVFDPPWNQQMMSEAAKLELGML